MSSTYEFTRSLESGRYNINNINRVDGSGKRIYLSKDIESALPGKKFKIICKGPSVNTIFDDPLSESDETILTSTINDHKNNV